MEETMKYVAVIIMLCFLSSCSFLKNLPSVGGKWKVVAQYNISKKTSQLAIAEDQGVDEHEYNKASSMKFQQQHEGSDQVIKFSPSDTGVGVFYQKPWDFWK